MALDFKNMLGSVFSKKSESFLGIDIGASSVKLIQIKKQGGGAILETYGEIALGPYAGDKEGQATSLPDSVLAQAIKDLMKESNVTAKDCGMAIPIKSSLIFTMTVPNVPQEKLATIVPIEARKYIPIPISEVTVDWRVIPKEQSIEDQQENSKEDNVEVLVIAVHKEAIESYNSIAKLAGLNLSFLEIEIFSSIRSVLSRGIKPVAILDIGSSVSKLYFVEYGFVRKSTIINKGSQDITISISKSLGISVEDAENLKREASLIDKGGRAHDSLILGFDRIFNDVAKNIIEYQTKNNRSIERLVFTGSGANVNGLLQYANTKISAQVEVADPFSKIQYPEFLSNLLKHIGPGFAVSLGLALRGVEG